MFVVNVCEANHCQVDVGNNHCVKGVCIWSFSCPYFSVFGLNTEYFFVFSPNKGKYRPENLRIRTLFTHERIIESFPAIHVLIWVNTILQHRLSLLMSPSQTDTCFQISWINYHQNFSYKFCYNAHILMLVNHLWLSCSQGVKKNLCIYLCPYLLQDSQSDLRKISA